MDNFLGAKVTITFTLKNLIDRATMDNLKIDGIFDSFAEYVKHMIAEEGLWGLVEDDYIIDEIKEFTE